MAIGFALKNYKTLWLAGFLGLLALLLIEPDRIQSDLGSLLSTQEIPSLEHNAPNTLLVAVKGFDTQALRTAQSIKTKLQALRWVDQINFSLLKSGDTTRADRHLRRIQGAFNPVPVEQEELLMQLHSLHEKITTSTLYQGIDRDDPLGLFRPPENPPAPPQKSGYLILPGYGYLLMATLNFPAGDLKKARHAESQLEALLSKSQIQTRHFSPFLYTAQNSRYIETEAKALIAAAVGILLLLYLVMLREPIMLLTALIVLFASSTIATLTLQTLLGQVALMALVFGAAISSVAIDYLFHHYTHGHYHRPKGFNREVFFGFLTTVAGFAAFSLVPFELVRQMSLFAIVALTIAYLFFALGLKAFLAHKAPRPSRTDDLQSPKPGRHIFSAALILGGILLIAGLVNFKSESNLRALDYDNQPLKQMEERFKEALPALNSYPALIKAPTREDLLEKIAAIRATHGPLSALSGDRLSRQTATRIATTLEAYDFDRLRRLLIALAPQAGFSPNAFKEAYRFIPQALQALKERQARPIGQTLKQDKNGQWVTLMLAPDEATAEAIGAPFSHTRILSEGLIQAQKKMLLWGGVALLIVALLILYKTRKEASVAFAFVLLPIAVALLVATLSGPVHIMHLFALFVLLVLGVDYGIYFAADCSRPTRQAIIYSLLSTFAGFGVLLFSEVGALHGVGLVITSGLAVVALLLLIVFYQEQNRRETGA
jgi:predicted exporter